LEEYFEFLTVVPGVQEILFLAVLISGLKKDEKWTDGNIPLDHLHHFLGSSIFQHSVEALN